MTTQDPTFIETPTVKQIRIAFEQTPSKLRAAEQGWRARRKQEINRIPQNPRDALVDETKGRLDFEYQAKHPSAPRVASKVIKSAKPTTAPPTPPPTPPTNQDPQYLPELEEEDSPLPILIYPLAPSRTAIPLGCDGSLSIPQSPSSPYECIVRIGHQHTSVARGGNTLEVDSEGKRRTIHREDHKTWSARERKQWEMVRDLVEQVKRKTPRVSLHDLG
jgi:hypothetical protein